MLSAHTDLSDTSTDGRDAKRLRSRPVLYLSTVLTVMAVTFLFSLRWDGILACPANEYSGEDRYLAYCHAKAYGDYDHGAFWFGLEPIASSFAASADVLFVGNSRMQFGFSTSALQGWFATNGLRYYLLGFSHFENATFTGPLLQALRPKAKVYIINVDGFFVSQETLPGRDVMRGSDTRRRYVSKQAGQTPHRLACTWLSGLCGHEISFYRQRTTGEWRLGGRGALEPSAVESDLPIDTASVARQKAIAARFIAALHVQHQCILLTYVPTRRSERAAAAALAFGLGHAFISPQMTGLQTFDGSHLDRASAERFVEAFLKAAAPLLQRCLGGREISAPNAGAVQ